jgi:UDP-N-acetylglucosamine--N-acetylmuramyl-(pentapeptide) pyrophosphoryl-undecaprenol N-acetylglucosamine transferase
VSAPFVLAAGGTGGHVFPAEALAGELLASGRTVHLLCDGRADDFARRLPGVEVHRVPAGRLGGGPGQAVHGLAGLALGVVQARRLLRRLAPAGVVGFGGYPSVPTMLAARYLGLPTIVHEQNAILGRANRLLVPRAHGIATGFPSTAGLRPADSARAVHTGNPIRPAILAFAETGLGYAAPPSDGPIELLILGGSQGARVLGEVVPPALAALPAEFRGMLRISQQVRSEDLSAVAEIYRHIGVAAELSSFFDDVPTRLARAHLAICRAGASTVAELAACGRPAVLIPYPHATDDHQTANARAFAEAGGGWVVPQSSLSPAVLSRRLEHLLGDRPALAAAAARASSFGRRDATRHLARLVLDLDLRAALPAALPGRAA